MRVSNIITVTKNEPFYNKLLKYAKENLVFDNPTYLKNQQMGIWNGRTPKHIKLFNENDNELILPFGVLEHCFAMKAEIEKPDFPDRPINIKSNIVLREYQRHAVNSLIKYKNGLLLMFAGSGKTQTALQAICEIGQKTLFMTHTQDLITQAKMRAEYNMTASTSLITEGKSDVSGDIVFATVQTLVKFVKSGEIDPRAFGMVIIDEVHRLCTNAESTGMFQVCIEHFECRFKLGLTATAHRADGMFNAVKAIIGEPLYEMVRDDKNGIFSCQSKSKELCQVKITDFQVLAIVHQIKTEYTITGKHDLFNPDGGTIIFAKLITDLTSDIVRNLLILEKLKELKDSRTLVVSDRLSQLEYLCSQVENGAFIDGKTKKQTREQHIQDMRDCKLNYLFGSWKLVKEGIDIPCIDNIVFASPNKDYAIIVQCIGRGQRPFDGKDFCDVWDFCDVEVGFLKAMMYKRNSVYKKNGIKYAME